MKKISVIIPCHNSEKYLSICMDSLIQQTIGMQELEIILIDDASADHTRELLLDYEKAYPDSVMVILLEQNQMQGGARNVALQYASGEYLLFLDSDDWIVPDALRKLYLAAIEQTADVVEFLNRDVYSKEEEVASTKSDMPNELLVIDNEEIRRQFLLGYRPESTLGCWNKLYRTLLVREHNLQFAERVAFEEPPFTFTLRFYENRHYYYNEYLHYCLQNPEGTTRSITMREEHKCDHVIAQYNLLQQMDERELIGRYHDEIEWYAVHTYFIGSLLFMVGRCLYPDVDLLRHMQQTILHYFPRYQDNPYIQNDPTDSNLSRLIQIEINSDNIEEYNRQLRIIALEMFG